MDKAEIEVRCAKVADDLMNYFTFREYKCLAVPRERHSGTKMSYSPIPQVVEIYGSLEKQIRNLIGELGWALIIHAYHPEGLAFPRATEPETFDTMVPDWGKLQKNFFGTFKGDDAERQTYRCLLRISRLVYK